MTTDATFRGDRYVALDNALTKAALDALRKAESSALFKPSFSAITPELDGVSFYSNVSLGGGHSSTTAFADEVRGAVATALGHLESTSGDPEIDQCRYWRYPRGVGLDWHDDGAGRSAAFILYLSQSWRASWGGELELYDCGTGEVPCVHNNVVEDLMNAPVLATAILPKPNRLVVMKAGTFHRVRQVDSNAGDNLRRSLSGFIRL